MSGLDAALAAVSGGGPPLPGINDTMHVTCLVVQLDLTPGIYGFGFPFHGTFRVFRVESIWVTLFAGPLESLI